MVKTWTWSTTSGSLRAKTPEQIRDTCLAAGLGGIEATASATQNMTDAELESFRRTFEDAGLKVVTFHLPFTAVDDIASFYNTSRESTVRSQIAWFDRAVLIGATIGIQHPTTTRFDVAVEGLERYLGHISKSLDTLLPAAESRGFTIAIENMLKADGGRFGSEPEHFARIAAKYDSPALGFCLDTGHALVSLGDRSPEMQDAMGKRTVAYHLADNAGDRDSHLAPGHGLVDWSTLFRKAAESSYTGTMCIETPPFAAGPPYSDDAYKGMVDGCERLVTGALS